MKGFFCSFSKFPPTLLNKFSQVICVRRSQNFQTHNTHTQRNPQWHFFLLCSLLSPVDRTWVWFYDFISYLYQPLLYLQHQMQPKRAGPFFFFFPQKLTYFFLPNPLQFPKRGCLVIYPSCVVNRIRPGHHRSIILMLATTVSTMVLDISIEHVWKKKTE